MRSCTDARSVVPANWSSASCRPVAMAVWRRVCRGRAPMKTSLVGGASAAAAIRSDAMGGGKEGYTPRECNPVRVCRLVSVTPRGLSYLLHVWLQAAAAFAAPSSRSTTRHGAQGRGDTHGGDRQARGRVHSSPPCQRRPPTPSSDERSRPSSRRDPPVGAAGRAAEGGQVAAQGRAGRRAMPYYN